MSRYLTRQTPGIRVWQDGKEGTPLYGGEKYELVDKASDERIRGDEAWKLDVGAECNRLLEHAAELDRKSGGDDNEHSRLASDIHSLMARVAEFEELEVEPE